MLSLQFDLPRLRRFSNIFVQIGSPSFNDSILAEMGDTAVDLIHREFDTVTDPYGKRWAPHTLQFFTKKGKKFRPPKKPSHPVLFKTGALKNTLRYKIINHQILRVYSPKSYAIFHQRGTHNMPQRLIFPEPLIGLPDSWKIAFSKVENRTLQRLINLSQTR